MTANNYSEFWFRGHRVAYLKDGHFNFDREGVMMPNYDFETLEELSNWLAACAAHLRYLDMGRIEERLETETDQGRVERLKLQMDDHMEEVFSEDLPKTVSIN